ncbi:hypothetical protein SteCoe_27872 [Stentor coeruleus]|uniref:BRCT domain-containing protein n=1 Tax=Stentor coeruleus TaxID=5963 RepID=A0A1R2B9I2_9CILI|nr:hypothetical protein SteCoe_27872 [Stentor coeruleus]
MKKSIYYQITSFLEEPHPSISGIRNIMISDPKFYWETPSDLAVVSINFQPITNFCISIRYANPFDLTIFSDTIQVYHKVYKKGSSTTINSQKFAKKDFLAEIDSLKFEFRRQGENIKIYFLLLKEQGPAKLTINGEKEPKTQKEIKNKIAILNKELLEKAKKKNKKSHENIIKEIEADNMDVHTAGESEDEKCLQQMRLKNFVENDKSCQQMKLKNYAEKENEKEKEKDNRNTEEKPNTRSNNGNVPKNSYENLLNDFIVYCDICDFDIRKIVIDLLQASGACYVENKTDFCTLIISDKILGTGVGNKIPSVNPQWLFQSVAKRKVQSFDTYLN